MDELLAAAGKYVLVKIVKLAQKRGMKGELGGGKEFVGVYDKKIGASVSDPAKRSAEELGAFLETLSEEDLKYLTMMFKGHSNREIVKQVIKSQDTESPEQVLVKIVKLAQKRGMKGELGGWKEFVGVYDKNFGASVSDPAKRSAEELGAFLQTLSEEDLKYLAMMSKGHSNREVVKQVIKSQDTESPEQTPDSERSKLFLHRIPKDVPTQKLHELISGDFTIQVQPNKKGRKDKYSAFAIFRNPQEANDVYEKLQGDEVQDSRGRLQKPISIELESGLTNIIFICKMHRDNPHDFSAKRSYDPTEPTGVRETKKLKMGA